MSVCVCLFGAEIYLGEFNSADPTALPVGFPDSSVGKESSCDVGDPGLIPGSGRSAGEGIGYPLQYSWASLVAQLIKNLPATRETWVQSLLGRSPGEGKGYPLQYSGLDSSLDCIVHGVAKSQRRLNDFHSRFLLFLPVPQHFILISAEVLDVDGLVCSL